MAIVVINGLTAYSASMVSPRQGVWQLDARVDDPTAISGAASVTFGARTLKGTVVRGGQFAGVDQVRILAGAGGMGTLASPQDYTAPTVGQVLGDLLGAAGETLSGTADGDVLGAELAGWTTTARPVGEQISELLSVGAPGAVWRVLDDGTVWVGTDSFPASPLSPSVYEVTERWIEENSLEVALDAPTPLVATTFEGGKVDAVQDDVPHIGPMRTRVWFTRPSPREDRLTAAIRALVRATPAGVDYRFLYLAAVAAQSGPTVDGVPDVAGVPQVASVPLLAQAGDSVDGVTGGKVAVGWNGDPSRRFAMGFTPEAIPATRALEVLTQLALGDKIGGLPLCTETLIELLSAFLAPAPAGPLGAYLAAIQSIADPSGTATTALTGAMAALVTALQGAVTVKTVAT